MQPTYLVLSRSENGHNEHLMGWLYHFPRGYRWRCVLDSDLYFTGPMHDTAAEAVPKWVGKYRLVKPS